MKSFVTWNQRKEMHEPQNRFNRFFDGFTQRTRDKTPGLMVADCWRKQAVVAEVPEVDVSKDAHEYLLKAHLPEVKKEDVTVTVQDDTLCVSGERKSEKADKGRKFGRMERWYGDFRRIFKLPDDANPSELTSNLRDGVLEVHLPITGSSTKESKASKLMR